MDMRVCGLSCIGCFLIIGIVSGAFTDYETTDYLGKNQLPTVYDAFDLNTVFTTLKDDGPDIGLASILNSGDDWTKEAEQIKKQNVNLEKEYSALTDPGDQFRKRLEIQKNQQLMNKINRLAIIKYAEDNKKGANNREISDRHLAIAATLEEMYPEGTRNNFPEYAQMHLAALEAASEADVYNSKAWNARVEELEALGRNDEAEEVKNERNVRIGDKALSRLVPLSPFSVLAGTVLAGLGFALFSRGKRKDPVS